MIKKYIILISSLIIGFTTLTFIRINLDFYDYYSIIMNIQLAGLIILLISILLTLIPKFRTLLVLKVLFIFMTLLLSSELVLSYQSFQKINDNNFTENYSNKTCDQLIERLEFDKTQNKFAYFSYGLALDAESIKLEFKEKYNVDVIAIGQSCFGSDKNDCYNRALMIFLNSRKTPGNN